MSKDTHLFVKRIEWRHRNDGDQKAFDEIVTGPVDSVHIEQLTDGSYWMAIEKDGKRQIIYFSQFGRRIVARTEAE